MQVFIKTFKGTTIKLDVNSFYKIKNLKLKIEEIEGIPVNKQRLTFAGK